MNILADASLPGLEAAFPAPFNLTRYNSVNELQIMLPGKDILLCRSTLKVNEPLLINSSLKYVTTASSGTDHLDHQYLHSRGIKIIDAKGCNATSVADYVLASLAYLSQQQLPAGNRVGIIGMGMVGTEVAKRFQTLNFNITHYDPLKASQNTEFKSCEFVELTKCDLICIHAELHDQQPYSSFNLINKHVLARLKPGCVIINAARGGIVNEDDLLNSTTPLVYCTDVYLNEPAVDPRIIDKSTLCTPHIAGHSLEAKYAAVSLVSEQLHRIAGLPIPFFASPVQSQTITLDPASSWQEKILSIYNPVDETLQLKKAADKFSTFLSSRKNHQNRHDFYVYGI